MNDQDMLLQAIRDDPGDAVVRLVYADWLEEQGELDRAELIRLQCKLAELPVADRQRQDLHDRERALLAKHHGEWLQPLEKLNANYRHPRFGFVEHIELTAKTFVNRAEVLFKVAAGIHQVTFRDAAGLQMGRLARCPYLERLSTINLWLNEIGDAGVEALADSPFTGKLRVLYLGHNRISSVGARKLAQTSNLNQLVILALTNNQIDDGGALALARAAPARFARLQTLNLRTNLISEAVFDVLRERFGAGVVLSHPAG